MATGKNKLLSKGKKGQKKRIVDPFLRKEWYDIKAPNIFEERNIGKTLVNRSAGQFNANDALKGRIVEASLADLQKDEEHAFRKVKFRIDEVQGRQCLTNIHGFSMTSDKIRSLVRKWQTTIEADMPVKTTDGYICRMFIIGFTRRRQWQVKKTSYAQSSQIRAIRKRINEIVNREAGNCSLKELVQKLIPEFIGREIEKASNSIYPLQNVYVRKMKILKFPKYDPQRLMELHTIIDQETGEKISSGEKEWKEPKPLESV